MPNSTEMLSVSSTLMACKSRLSGAVVGSNNNCNVFNGWGLEFGHIRLNDGGQSRKTHSFLVIL